MESPQNAALMPNRNTRWERMEMLNEFTKDAARRQNHELFWVNFPFSLLKMMHMVHQLLMPSCGNGTTSWCYDGLLLVTAPHGSWRYLGVSHDAPFPALGMTLPGQQVPICCSTQHWLPLCRIQDQFSAACHPPCHGRLCNLPQKQTDTNFAPVLLAQSSTQTCSSEPKAKICVKKLNRTKNRESLVVKVGS